MKEFLKEFVLKHPGYTLITATIVYVGLKKFVGDLNKLVKKMSHVKIEIVKKDNDKTE